MSLIINNQFQYTQNMPDSGPMEDQHDLSLLDQYLAVIEDNKKSCRFVPNDALVALDMATIARGHINGKHPLPHLSAARLALALAQPCARTPVQ